MSDHEHAPASTGRPPIHPYHITLLPITPPVPLVLCSPGFITELGKVERDIAHIRITDDATLQEAARLQTRLHTAGKLLEETRVKLKAPFLAKGKEIDKAAEAPEKRIKHAKACIGQILVDYKEQQEQKAAQAELERQAELDRLQLIADQEAAAERKRVADLAAEVERNEKERRDAEQKAQAAGIPITIDVDFGDDDDSPPPPPLPLVPEKTETQKKIDAVRFAPAVVISKPEGIKFTTRLVHTVVDVNKLPDLFVTRTAKDSAIRATFCNGWKEGEPIPVCDGVAFAIQRDATSTGKFEF